MKDEKESADEFQRELARAEQSSTPPAQLGMDSLPTSESNAGVPICPREYDLEAVYDEQVAPLMAQIIAICKEHKLPVFATFQSAAGGGDDEQFDYCTTNVLFPDARPLSDSMKSLAPLIRKTSSGFAAFTITTRKAE